MKQPARELIARFGSNYAKIVGWRDMWAMVVVKGGPVVREMFHKSPDFASWAEPVHLTAEVPLSAVTESRCEAWHRGDGEEEDRRRAEFCGKIEGYGSVCSCEDPAPLAFSPPPVLNNQIHDVPVVIIASNRPHYLYRSEHGENRRGTVGTT